MMAHSHVLFGLSCWWGYCLATGQDASTATTALAGLGALLPDIDHPQSAVGRRLSFISEPVAKVFGHRGITHSILAVAIIVFTLRQWSDYEEGVIVPLCIGYLSHLAGDMLTPSGVPLLWPVRRTFSLNVFRTGSPIETILVSTATVVMLYQADVSPGVLDAAQDGISAVLRHGPKALHLGDG